MSGLNDKQAAAAAHVAADLLTDAEICEDVGIKSRQTLYTWKTLPAFQERVQKLRDEFGALVRSRGIALVENRVAALDDRWKLMKRVIKARASDPEVASEAGADTGLISIVGYSKSGMPYFGVDTGLLKELREHELQAAKELGQLITRQSLEGGVKPITITSIEAIETEGAPE